MREEIRVQLQLETLPVLGGLILGRRFLPSLGLLREMLQRTMPDQLQLIPVEHATIGALVVPWASLRMLPERELVSLLLEMAGSRSGEADILAFRLSVRREMERWL